MNIPLKFILPQLQIETLREALELWTPYYIPKSKEVIKQHRYNNMIHLMIIES